jgi:prevent-host-death family protein
MPTIPQRTLRNEVSDVLRRAEGGERFTITVDGRPAAELGPLSGGRRPAQGGRLTEILLDAPVDPAWSEELRELRARDDDAAREPWAR